MNIDITVVLNVHGEGLLSQPTCSSLERARRHAEEQGVCIEILVVLDNATRDASEFITERAGADWCLLPVECDDLGEARNAGVRAAKGRWIAFLDGDDLFGNDWLSRAYISAEADERLIVWHPEFNVFFGADKHVLRHVDGESPEFWRSGLLCNNHWTALCFAPRSLLLDVPYPRSVLRRQMGYEDWSWNMEVMAYGAVHKAVPQTTHFIRVRHDSLVRRTSSLKSIPIPIRAGALLPRFSQKFEA